MLVVDSSVWIDYFNGVQSGQAELLDHLLQRGEVRLVVPDLVLFEVLRGFRQERDLRAARLLMESLSIEATIESSQAHSFALKASDHYRNLRRHGQTVRSPVDVLVATFCIERDYALLHNDRDFDAFELHRGLRVWRH
jgi:predicted nucleic acid-binding protein